MWNEGEERQFQVSGFKFGYAELKVQVSGREAPFQVS